jgi:SOS response regulatory protein OraA/RecX
MEIPVVTALRASGPGRVAVELDGAPWRVVPLEAVYGAGLVVGGPLDRATARSLARELRRLGAQALALRALRARDHTAASLEQRLAARGTSATVRRDTVEAAQRAGLVDDERFAMQRAEQLASRGAGDLLIGDDLERQGVAPDLARLAIGALEPEAHRAGAIVATRGVSPKTARYLASRGFSEAALETLVANLAADGLG